MGLEPEPRHRSGNPRPSRSRLREPAPPDNVHSWGTPDAGPWGHHSSGNCGPSQPRLCSGYDASACAVSRSAFLEQPFTYSLVLERPECLPPGVGLHHRTCARIGIPIHAARRTETSAIRVTDDVLIDREDQLLTHRFAHIKLSARIEHMSAAIVLQPWRVRGYKNQCDSVFETI